MKTYEEYKDIVEKELLSSMPEVPEESRILLDSMSYSLTAGGKRLRPVLVLASCDLAGGDVKVAVPYAVAMEYIHTYSLIHDDLPAMDDDDMRRGMKTNHLVFGPGMATLAGDGLLNSAFGVMLSDISETKDDPGLLMRKVRAALSIAEGAGVTGMIAGQAADIDTESSEVTGELIDFIEDKKTSSLITAAVRAGLLTAGADGDMMRKMTSYAENLGKAFQIADDILDVEGTDEELGKPTGSDEEMDKPTYVSRYGLDGAKEELRRLTEQACYDIKDIDGDLFFTDLVKMLEARKK